MRKNRKTREGGGEKNKGIAGVVNSLRPSVGQKLFCLMKIFDNLHDLILMFCSKMYYVPRCPALFLSRSILFFSIQGEVEKPFILGVFVLKPFVMSA